MTTVISSQSHRAPIYYSDVLLTSPIINENGGLGGEDVGGDANDLFEFGVDPSADPELVLALRMSMEEEKARQEKEKKEKEMGASSSKPDTIPEESAGSSSKKDDDRMEL